MTDRILVIVGAILAGAKTGESSSSATSTKCPTNDGRAFELRVNVTAYDAAYVALARASPARS
jgi:hypothetical protein